MTKEAAIYTFYSQFLPAYEENSVPETAKLPYLTYSIATSAFLDGETMMNVNLWYGGTSWRECNAKSAEISAAIGIGGEMLKCDGGYIWLKRGSPFSQNMAGEDDMIKRKLLTITAEFLTAN